MVDTARASGLRDLIVVAIDWSGARAVSAQRRAIATATVRDGTLHVDSGRTRTETVEHVLAMPPPLVVGFDFSFGFPAWVCECRRVTTGPDFWAVVAAEGETWLENRRSPFHGYAKGDRPNDVELLRVTERQLRAKSSFQSNGKGTVGTGTVRGIPYLARLRDEGFAIWPFDTAGERTVVEIYPSALRRVHAGEQTYATEHERDAAISALVMWEHRTEFTRLRASTDPIAHLEGEVWMPRSTMWARVSSPTSP
jgi:hypothetical protein